MSITLTRRPTRVMTPAQVRLRAQYRNLALWTLQGWVAMFFTAAGYAKVSEPMDNLVALMTWPAHIDERVVRGLGLIEFALALGLLAPLISWRWGRTPLLVSAAGLIAVEGAMLSIHAVGLAFELALTNGVLLLLTVAIFMGRRLRTESI